MNLAVIFQAIINGISIGFVYSIVALGLTLIWGTMRIINFAHGDFLMMGMYATFWIFMLIKIDPLLSCLLIVMPVSFGAGLLYYRVILKHILKREVITQILATFGVGIILQSIAMFFWKPDYRIIRGNILSGTFRFVGISIGIPQFVTSIICIIAMLALFYFLNRTKTGLAIRATTLNKEAAALVGINIENIYYLVVGIGISLVGLAGNLLTNYYYVFPNVGMSFALFAYVIIVLGGLGSVKGALAGGLILGIVTSLTGAFLNPAFKYIAVFLVYLMVVVIKPEGLGGR